MAKQSLIDKIEEAMATDGDRKNSESVRMKRLYKEANAQTKETIDQIFICLCGWSLGTLIKGK